MKYNADYYLLPKWKQDKIDDAIERGLRDSDEYRRLLSECDVAEEVGDDIQYNKIIEDMDAMRLKEYALVMTEIDFSDEETRYMTKGNNRVY